MGWLVGLPLGIFRILFSVLMLAVRFAVPLAVIAVAWYFLCRFHARKNGGKASKEPAFDGPVYEVDYKIVEDEKEE